MSGAPRWPQDLYHEDTKTQSGNRPGRVITSGCCEGIAHRGYSKALTGRNTLAQGQRPGSRRTELSSPVRAK